MIKRVRQRFDWGLLLALTLALVAAAPFLTRPGLPHDTDAELHVYRAAELGHTLHGGAFYPRWAPDFYFGYGYPIFNYYAPLTYYLANLFDLFPGVDIVGGVKAVFVLGLIVASVGTYLLGRDMFGAEAGVLAAASFTFSPYVVFIDPHARGVLAEHFAVCLLPLTFFAFHRLLNGVGGRGTLLGSVLTLAALVFSHNLLGVVSGVLLLLYWVWEVVFGAGRSRAGWGVLAFALAAAMIAFFWLPFLLERNAIKFQVIGPGHFDFREHFLPLSELLAPSRILDMGATAPHYRFNLGLAQWLLALPAFAVVLRRRASSVPSHIRIALLFFVFSGMALIFLMLPISAPVWEHIPGMAYLQFPWRLMGPVNLALAVCAASFVALVPEPRCRWRNPALATAFAGILLLALPVLYPPTWSPDFGGTLPLDIIEWERRSLALGTTSTGDFLPRKAARVRVKPAPSLIESYAGAGPIDRVNRAALPEGAMLDIVEHGPLYDRFAISTSEKFVFRLYTFYFPGWRAYVDGEEVEIKVAGPEGFITLWVPEGEHEVLVRFEDTPPRTAGWAISAVGLAILGVALLLIPSHEFPNRPPILNLQSSIWLGGVLVSFIVLKSVILDPHDDWLRYTSPPGQAWGAQYEQRANFGGQIELLGYDLPKQRIRSGETSPVVLYWHALLPMDVNYQTFVHLAWPLHVVWGQEDHLNPGGLPTTRWPVDRHVWDEYDIQVLPGTPPGEYALNVGLYSMAGGYRLSHYDEAGHIIGDGVVIASVEVERPLRQPRLSELDMTRETMVVFPEGGVTLLGYTQPDHQVTLPGVWPITLFWRADREQPTARVRALVLLDAGGQKVWQLEGIPAEGHYPFEVWQAGGVVRDPLQFVSTQPPDLEAGVYQFGVTVNADMDEPLNPEGTSDGLVLLGTVEFLIEEGTEE
jgi:hypothetical protein